MVDLPFVLIDSELADWAELNPAYPDASPYEMNESARTPDRAWTRLIQYNYNGSGPVVLDLKTSEGQAGLEKLRTWATDGTLFVGHNLLFDLPWLWKQDVRPEYIFDTMVASQMIWCGTKGIRHRLSDVITRLTGCDPYGAIVLASVQKTAAARVAAGELQPEAVDAFIAASVEHGKTILQKSSWARPELTPEQLAYAAADVGPEYAETFKALSAQLTHLGLTDQFELEMQTLPIVAQMAEDGLKFDLKVWKEYIEEQKVVESSLSLELLTQLNAWVQQLFPERFLITLRRKAPLPGKPERRRKDGTLIRAAVPAQTLGDLTKIQPRPVYVPFQDQITPELLACEVDDTHIGSVIRKELGLDAEGDTASLTQPVLLREVCNALLGIKGDGFDADEVAEILTAAEREKNTELAEWLKKYQQDAKLRKLISTYGESYWSYADNRGYIHARFSTTDADTNRIQASQPNVVNAPRFLQKMLWVTEEGEAQIKCDYSAEEGRLLFYLGNQRDVYERLDAGMDLHCMTLSFKTGLPYDRLVNQVPGKKDTVKPEYEDERIKAKPGTFAPCYGAQAHKMAETFGISDAAGNRFIENYWCTYPEVKKMQDKQWYRALHLEYTTDLSFGRKRFYLKTQKQQDAHAAGKSWEKACFDFRNAAFNYACQTTGANILRFAMLRVAQMVKDHPQWGAVLRLTIHDALLMTCKAAYANECGAELQRQMELAAKDVLPGIRIPADLDIHFDKTAPAYFAA